MSDTVKIPTNADEAQLMLSLGYQYLLDNAPEKLTDYAKEIATLKRQLEEHEKTISLYRAGWSELDERGMDEASRIIGRRFFKSIEPPSNNPPIINSK